MNKSQLVQRITGDLNDTIELPSETKMSLSLIEGGCLAVSINRKTVFIYKNDSEEIESLKRAEPAGFEIECMIRPEFPSVGIKFHLKKKNKSHWFEYLFGIAAEEEMSLLRTLFNQENVDILFFDSEIQYSKRFIITEDMKESIKAALLEAETASLNL